MKGIYFMLFVWFSFLGCNAQQRIEESTITKESKVKNEDELRKTLTKEQCHVLLDGGTEMAFSGKYDKHFEDGVYKCAACDNPLYISDTKYDSGSGWPAFWAPVEGSVEYSMDYSFGMIRTEVHCAKCGGHLGHVFNDGPQETTGKRHCINSVALNFEESKLKEDM